MNGISVETKIMSLPRILIFQLYTVFSVLLTKWSWRHQYTTWSNVILFSKVFCRHIIQIDFLILISYSKCLYLMLRIMFKSTSCYISLINLDNMATPWLLSYRKLNVISFHIHWTYCPNGGIYQTSFLPPNIFRHITTFIIDQWHISWAVETQSMNMI